jgi:RIO kinase 1
VDQYDPAGTRARRRPQFDDVPDFDDDNPFDEFDDDLHAPSRSRRGPARRRGGPELEGPYPYSEPRCDQRSDQRSGAQAESEVPQLWSADAQPAWSSWLGAVHGPQPRPEWVVTELGAIDAELGLLKTGKEADVHLVERAVPNGPSCLLAAKRYRDPARRLFHRDAGYLEGRRIRRSRETRAMARRTGFGRDLISAQWAQAEFEALSRLWQLHRQRGGIRVPYPVQLHGTELLLEFIGEPDGVAAPRLAQTRPEGEDLARLWQQLVDLLIVLASQGLAHGDLSAYNLLVHRGELVLIDLPQVVDVVANPQGVAFLTRDVAVTVAWFAARGLPARIADEDAVTAMLLEQAGLT